MDKAPTPENGDVVADPVQLVDATFRGASPSGGADLLARNFPGNFLRHAAFRVRLNANDGSELFRPDATFCAQPGQTSGSVRLASINELGSWFALGSLATKSAPPASL